MIFEADEGGEEVATKRRSSDPEMATKQGSSDPEGAEDDDVACLLDTNLPPKNEESDLLALIDQDLDDQEPVGPKINEKLAQIIDRRFTTLLSSEKVKEKQTKYLRPANCEKLLVPSINKVIKDMMSSRTLAREKPLQFTQLAITKASCALSVMANDLLTTSEVDTRVLVTTITDVLALLGHAHVTLSHKRRDALAPDLKKCYGGLKSPDIPITNHLFGDDVLKTMADLKKASSTQSEARYNQPKNSRMPRDRGYQRNLYKGKQQQKRFKPYKKQSRKQ